MKRREALQRLGFGLSGTMLLPPWLASCIEDPPIAPVFAGKVLVIGAGASGLYAADLLNARGVEVDILEAGSYPGGRIRTQNSFNKPTEALLFNPDNPLSNDFPIELGAEKVLGSNSLWSTILTQQKVPLTDLSTVENRYLIDATDKLQSFLVNTDAEFNAALILAESLENFQNSNLTAAGEISAAGIAPKWQPALEGLVGNAYGTSNARLGMKSVGLGASLSTRNREIQTLVANPMQNALLSRFGNISTKIKTNHVVTGIDYTGEKVIVSGEDRTGETAVPFSMEADKVFVTVPVSVLKSGSIAFTPALPGQKTEALSNMRMDAAVRVFLDFKRNFWGINSGIFYGGVIGPEYFNSGIGRSRFSRILSVTAYGSAAENLSQLGYDAIPALLAELDSYFGGAASTNVRRDPITDEIIGLVMDWSKQPFIEGGISYLVPGAVLGHRTNLGKPVDNKLFFAGEATDDQGEAGTVNGALASAERAMNDFLSGLT